MPISSGANSWPASYWHKPSPKQQNTKLVVIDHENSRPPSPIRKPSTPPPPPPAQPRPPPPSTMTETMYIEEHSPPPQKVYFQTPPLQQQTSTYISQQRQPPPPHMIYSQPPQSNHMRMVSQGGYPGYHQYPGYPGYGYGNGGGGGCGGDSSCCGDDYFSTNTAGANAGCCQGGMFGSRSYPYSQEQLYMMKGSGRRRCCACVWGLILGLLLLGLLIGLLAGLLPALKKKEAVNKIINQFKGGYLLNGVYYYQVTNPPDLFYFAMGPGIPCNTFNNNSDLTPPPPVFYYSPVNGTLNSTNVTITFSVTPTPQVTLPNCNAITTSYVLAKDITVSTTTINPFLALTSSADIHYAKSVATLLAGLVVARVMMAFGGGCGVA